MAVSVGFFQIKSVNMAMEIYDQIDIDPIYQSSIIFFNMMSGAIIMDEIKMYTNHQLIGLVSSAFVCVYGVLVIVRKPETQVEAEDEDNYKRNDTYFLCPNNDPKCPCLLKYNGEENKDLI